jgi:hypothetical protein
VAGAGLSWRVIVVIAVASTIANSIYTGVSEFLSSRAHKEYIQAEKRRELWEYKNFKEAQVFEVRFQFHNPFMPAPLSTLFTTAAALLRRIVYRW